MHYHKICFSLDCRPQRYIHPLYHTSMCFMHIRELLKCKKSGPREWAGVGRRWGLFMKIMIFAFHFVKDLSTLAYRQSSGATKNDFLIAFQGGRISPNLRTDARKRNGTLPKSCARNATCSPIRF